MFDEAVHRVNDCCAQVMNVSIIHYFNPITSLNSHLWWGGEMRVSDHHLILLSQGTANKLRKAFNKVWHLSNLTHKQVSNPSSKVTICDPQKCCNFLSVGPGGPAKFPLPRPIVTNVTIFSRLPQSVRPPPRRLWVTAPCLVTCRDRTILRDRGHWHGVDRGTMVAHRSVYSFHCHSDHYTVSDDEPDQLLTDTWEQF